MLLKKSLMIAEKLGDTMSRLTKDSIYKNNEKINQLNNEIYGKYNFKPEINKFSEKIIKKKRGKSIEKLGNETTSKSRWEELYSMVIMIIYYINIFAILIHYRIKIRIKNMK